MGRSKSSCFKVLPCGNGAADEDAPPSERNSSRDKGWLSFRKRSSRHRVLTNAIVSESPSSLSNDLTEAAAAPEKESAVVTWSNEKTSTVVAWEEDEKSITEKPSSVTWADEKPVTEKASTVTWADEKPNVNSKETEGKFDSVNVTAASIINPDESTVIVIQAAVRTFLAQRELLKVKNVVKLQATVRGYLVRRHAVGTLRCVQAIVKMQALVRTRQARLSFEKDKDSSLISEKGNRPNGTHASIEKLLANKFARQILESTPKTKSINIKCDPSKSDSAWKWLERWMMITSLERENQTQKPDSSVKQQDEDIELSSIQGENKSIFEECKSTGVEEMQKQIADTVKVFKHLESSDPENINSLVSEPISASANDNKIPDMSNTYDNSLKQSDLVSQTGDLPKFGISEMQSEPINIDISGQPMVLFSQVKSNSAQSGESLCLQNANLVSVSKVEPNSDSFKPEIHDEESTFSKYSTLEQLQPEELDLMVGSIKECNPEPIAAQTKFENLNSEGNIARSVVEDIADPELDSLSSAIVKETETNNTNSTLDLVGNADCETELPSLSMIHSLGGHKDESVNDVEYEVKNETDNGSINITKWVEPISEAVVEAIKPVSSEAASPRSHFTATESQGTPSTQISVNSKKAKTDKSGASQKRRSLSTGRRSPSNYKLESGLRSSLDNLPKSTKLRHSLDKTDSGDSSSLPSYMQLTESMRAKAYSSPRSSPDVQERESFLRKRHSLPIGNTKQESPRIMRSTSLAHHVAKGNDHSNERRWQV
ncbi:protein IQ-DOMAIN 32-like [Impatiens glandulifera]|uniref:protein IQ-DOMAIN 32-like n=1 Tax=Impatiens glandulifera TaxID=253017 RepID=UPI001FB11EB8|nr:protein IQ-DOMAIN 32-like [Impatiens glandulifera]